jgi:hypothetical protein
MDNNLSTATSGNSLATTITAVVLFLSLVFLTAANFFVYADYHFEQEITWSAETDGKNSTGPLEENSKSCKGPTVTEEYLHDKNFLHDLYWRAASVQHRVRHTEQLTVIHYDTISPPPKA